MECNRLSALALSCSAHHSEFDAAYMSLFDGESKTPGRRFEPLKIGI